MYDLDQATAAFIENEKLEQTNDYLHRGRRYAALAPAELEAQWVAAFRDFAADIGDDEDLVRMFDLEAEYRLRGVALPEELVVAEREAFDRSMDAWAVEDPESWDRTADEMMDDIARFAVDASFRTKS
jgi:hypothetical protein